MSLDAHERARQLIALGDFESASSTDKNWLQSHMQNCDSCRDYADATGQVVRSLRSVPLAASPRLVRATQSRVRFHAARLRETRARLWLMGMACLSVGLTATLTVPLLWRLFAWMGEWAGVSTLVWQTGFMFFFITPALVVSMLLLARGTHWTNSRERSRQWR